MRVDFPEPETRPLHDYELTRFKIFVDRSPWLMLVDFWGITEIKVREGKSTLEYQRRPVFTRYTYDRKQFRQAIKAEEER